MSKILKKAKRSSYDETYQQDMARNADERDRQRARSEARTNKRNWEPETGEAK